MKTTNTCDLLLKQLQRNNKGLNLIMNLSGWFHKGWIQCNIFFPYIYKRSLPLSHLYASSSSFIWDSTNNAFLEYTFCRQIVVPLSIKQLEFICSVIIKNSLSYMIANNTSFTYLHVQIFHVYQYALSY